AECVGQGAGMLHDVVGRMHGRQADNPFLQVDENERGFGVERGNGHNAVLSAMTAIPSVALAVLHRDIQSTRSPSFGLYRNVSGRLRLYARIVSGREALPLETANRTLGVKQIAQATRTIGSNGNDIVAVTVRPFLLFQGQAASAIESYAAMFPDLGITRTALPVSWQLNLP
ncbi:MAG: hypothetical protein JWM77_2733, partial [Rhodospirillales bacterium]|nr:hypothetical protein [Rhodospirillales bacterium]